MYAARTRWTKWGRGMIHIPGWTEQMAHPHAIQNGGQFEMHELLFSGIFHLKFLDRGGPWVTKTSKTETVDQGRTTLTTS